MKHLNILRGIILSFMLFCANAVFAHDIEVDGIYYKLSKTDKTVCVTYKGEDPFLYPNRYTGDVLIPDKVTYNGTTYTVTSIGAYAFSECMELTSVTIGSYVTSIEEGAFQCCRGLTSVIIPNSVTSIGSFAFNGCTGLTSITIPNSVANINEGAWAGCYSLENIIVEDGNYIYDSRENCNAIIETATNSLILGCKNTVITNSVTSIGGWAFYDCSGLTSVEIPNSVTSIGVSAFSDCSGLTSVEIPNSVTSIKEYAFNGCTGLTSVIIPSSVTIVRHDAFDNCISLKSVCIEDAETTMSLHSTGSGDTWFRNCPLETLYLGRNLSYKTDYSDDYYDDNVYSYSPFCNNSTLKSVTIGRYVTSFEKYLFYGCTGLTSITIPNNVTSICERAFYKCKSLRDVCIEDGEGGLHFLHSNSNSNNAFYGCPLETLYLGRNLSYATFPNADSPFCNNSTLKSVTIGKYVTSFENGLFYGCTGLTSITIPNSVTSIGNGAFEGCTSLTDLCVEDGIRTLQLGYKYSTTYPYIGGQGLFYDCPLKTLYLGRNLSYKTDSKYGYSPFYKNGTLTAIIIGNSVTSIGNSAFKGCAGLTRVYLLGENPPAVGEENFTTEQYLNLQLYVPEGTLGIYQVAETWKEFWDIQEFDATGIKNVDSDAPVFKYTNNGIVFTNAINKNVAVYASNGLSVVNITNYKGEEIALERGYYIISVNEKSMKIMVK